MEKQFKITTKVPSDAERVKLYGTDGKPWSISLLMYKEEIPRIKNRKTVVVKDDSINLFFPFEGKMYGKKVKKNGGFTIKDLIKGSQKLALKVIKTAKQDGFQSFSDMTAEQVVAGYGVYGFEVYQNQVYVSAKHIRESSE